MLKKIWTGWMKFGRWLGDYVARLLYTGFYFTIVLPFGLIVRLTQDPLNIKPKTSSNWSPRQPREQSLDEARRSF